MPRIWLNESTGPWKTAATLAGNHIWRFILRIARVIQLFFKPAMTILATSIIFVLIVHVVHVAVKWYATRPEVNTHWQIGPGYIRSITGNANNVTWDVTFETDNGSIYVFGLATGQPRNMIWEGFHGIIYMDENHIVRVDHMPPDISTSKKTEWSIGPGYVERIEALGGEGNYQIVFQTDQKVFYKFKLCEAWPSIIWEGFHGTVYMDGCHLEKSDHMPPDRVEVKK